jgi:hypothetical protein
MTRTKDSKPGRRIVANGFSEGQAGVADPNLRVTWSGPTWPRAERFAQPSCVLRPHPGQSTLCSAQESHSLTPLQEKKANTLFP